ncbi:polyprotein [Rhynchospora pubera]|uniref:Polyprotein n=1 Tax=Rhynchospora pubera TaxID=906938 RepID=A0AAV8FBC7_9POAL|nr:polyprotein [Rhynchospora pubera]
MGSGSAQRSFRRLTASEMAERRQKGLCFNCDEQYVRGHKCKRLFWLEVMDDDDQEDSSRLDTNETPNISLHALTGIGTSQTMKLQVQVNNCTFIALVDSGSTHNFLSSTAACKIPTAFVPRPGVRVRVANGDLLPTAGFCAALPIQVGQETFCVPCYSIALDEFDMVLGVQWLRLLGPILWDLSELTMTIQRDSNSVTWHGMPDTTITGLHSLATTATDLLSELLSEFADLFKEPQGLPPHRRQDHCIHLRTNAEPVAVRPYRYPHIQKDEIERQCATMLQQGIIRPSTSPFSSPVLLVKKQDQTWRFCVDYRALNAQTVRDKFPIPVVEELLDELQGSRFFSKLDLRSGYHQVRMHPADVYKTAFRTHHGHFEFLVMPFGLTNAPATFQAVMNEAFYAHIHCLLNNPSAHLQIHQWHIWDTLYHLRGYLWTHKRSKAISDWPQPTSTRALRGFLGLAGYYRKFIKDFGRIAVPLNHLLKKEGFQWSPKAEEAFKALKIALQTAPSLQMSNFEIPFIVECDASGSGIGAVLHQGDRPLAFFSRPISPHHAKLAAYERELIGVVKAVRHWRPYLWGRAFIVRTDHYSLKFLLDQRLSTVPQHHWVDKLFGFDFTIEYRPGRLNTVADALSPRDTESLALHSISIPQFQLYDLLREEVNTLAAFQDLRNQHQEGNLAKEWSFCDGLFLRQHRIFVPASSSCLQPILTTAHGVGHEGVQKTLHRIRRDFYIPQLKQLVQDFVRSCPLCQQHKVDHLHPAGLLQPLPIPARIWSDISMDFIEGFPKSHGKSVILTVVDRFSKYAHFIPLAHPYNACSVAQVFFEAIVKLHGIPESIVSDRDTVFTSNFWIERFRMMGVRLNFFSAFHPQSDGQSEVVNRTIEMYLRCLECDRPKQWLQWLPWAEFCYNTSFHTSLRATPFEVVYGRAPPPLLPYTAGKASVQAVDQQLQQRDEFLREIHNRLLETQQRMKLQYDKLHRNLEFQLDEWVWVRMQRRQATAITPAKLTKLSPKFYGPYQIKEKLGSVAYRVELPRGARIHNVFHVSLLKAFHGTPPTGPPPLPDIFHGKVIPSPATILRSRLARGCRELLVHWQNTQPEDATWISLDDFRTSYPTFQLEDKLLFNEGGNDIDAFIGQKYKRRAKGNQKN